MTETTTTESTGEITGPSTVEVSGELADGQHVVVIGGGMVGQRFVAALRERDPDGRFRVTMIAEESWLPYDRVALTSYFSGRTPEDLALGEADFWDHPRTTLRTGVRASAVDRAAGTVTLSDGSSLAYDHLVLATGSYAAVPPVEGKDADGCFVYRTIDDVQSLREHTLELARTLGRPVRGVVVGGGLLGLEAAGALNALGARTSVVEFAPRLMPMQVDEGGGAQLRRIIESMGVEVRTATATQRIHADASGHVAAMEFADGERVDADVVVFATGVRPRDELARECGLEVGERGGILVDDFCATSDERISSIGEVAQIQGRCWGLVAPGYSMAEVVAERMVGGTVEFPGADTATKLKLLGVDVASFGDAFAEDPDAVEIVFADPVAGSYKKIVLSQDGRTLLGGIFVGDASAYASLRPQVGSELAGDPAVWVVPEGLAAAPQADLPDEAGVCSCNNVTAGAIRGAVCEGGCTDLAGVKACTKAGTSCGSCLPLVKSLVETELKRSGIEVSNALCEHFDMSRAELFNAVRVSGMRTFRDILARHGRGRGCEVCKPTIGSILASLNNGHVLAGEQATLQDTNDHMLANLQKNGTYSVVPRIAGGEITPEGLIVIGEVARDFGLYTKITGGQRIDMFGARVEQLPQIWKRLVDAGFESGQAYGKSLRTVKSCVGRTWCRFGVQDSVKMAVDLELRYRGLRSPHKLKVGVSGCARECAEARGKDVGVIATDKGWNLYVGGNGGFTPKHAQLLAEDLDDATLVQAIDRFFIYYIRTADRLQRTAPWLEALEGGLDHLRAVIFEDSLGIADDLDRAMAAHVDSYTDEWAAVLQDPEKLARFSSFVNDAERPDPDLAWVRERGQIRPADADDRRAAAAGEVELVDADRRPVLIGGPTLPRRTA